MFVSVALVSSPNRRARTSSAFSSLMILKVSSLAQFNLTPSTPTRKSTYINPIILHHANHAEGAT